jgi:3-oxoacyl-[acyl-carrier-protein] synthase III
VPETLIGPIPARDAPGAIRGAAVGSVAAALPETVVTNVPIAERLGVDERWIVERTGVAERRVARPDERLSDLAATAGRRALERAGLDPADLDMVLVGTTSQDELMPNAAPLVAAALGAERAAAVDIGAACTAFIASLALAAAHIEARRADTVLVIGADLLTRFVDPDDKRTAALFGDGAGAVVMTPAGFGRVGPALLHGDGIAPDLFYASRSEGRIRMQGHETFKHAVARLSEVTVEALAAAGLGLADVDLFVYHQANRRILRAVSEQLGLPGERVVDCIDRYGNTSAASIPIALREAEVDGRLPHGARVLLAAFGAGFTWGGVALEWGHERSASGTLPARPWSGWDGGECRAA